MRGVFIRWFFLAVSISVASYLVGGIHVADLSSAILAAAVLGFLNAFFRPVLLILTLPLNLLTLGLFTFVINAVLLMMASGVIGGFSVDGFGSALLGSLVISIISWLLTSFISGQGTLHTIDLTHRGGNRWE